MKNLFAKTAFNVTEALHEASNFLYCIVEDDGVEENRANLLCDTVRYYECKTDRVSFGFILLGFYVLASKESKEKNDVYTVGLYDNPIERFKFFGEIKCMFTSRWTREKEDDLQYVRFLDGTEAIRTSVNNVL